MGQGGSILSGYNLADADTLPDFDDMVVDSDERSPPVFSQTEQFGPPELGTNDDDLYVPVSANRVLSGLPVLIITSSTILSSIYQALANMIMMNCPLVY
jgi:hypothetical protein